MTKKYFHKTNSLKRKTLNEQLTDLTSNNVLNDDDIINNGGNSNNGNNGNNEDGSNNYEQKGEGDSLYSNNNDFMILSNLTVLSKIQKYDKLVIVIDKDKKNEKIDFEIKIDNTYIKSLSRWYYGQTRNLTIDYINKLIDIAILSYNQSNNKITMNKYITLLESSKLGLANLKFTYYHDQTIISNLDIIIEKIDMFKINVIT
jgi:hypothetical protein